MARVVNNCLIFLERYFETMPSAFGPGCALFICAEGVAILTSVAAPAVLANLAPATILAVRLYLTVLANCPAAAGLASVTLPAVRA